MGPAGRHPQLRVDLWMRATGWGTHKLFGSRCLLRDNARRTFVLVMPREPRTTVIVRNSAEQPTMICDLIDLLGNPDAHACIWRNGEIYIEPIAAPGKR